MSPPPPLRFLLLVVGGWACGRAAVLGLSDVRDVATTPPPPHRVAHAAAPPLPLPPEPSPPQPVYPAGTAGAPVGRAPVGPLARQPLVRVPRPPPALALAAPPPLAGQPEPQVREAAAPLPLRRTPIPVPDFRQVPSRWTFSAWAFVRGGTGSGLAPGGTLGGSQVGGRVQYRVGAGLALSARVYSPARRPRGAEAAAGLDWQPSGKLPVHLLAERREALGEEGRSAFGLTAYGGVDDVRLGRLRIDAYGQAGVVGARSRDLFADGAARLSLPLGRSAKVGVGTWGAAQPAVERLDVGPQASIRLPVAGRSVTLAADWRFRIAGNAKPGSGPSLTLATDF